MGAPRAEPVLVTEEEYLALPETVERMELLDGEVLVSPAPTPLHQTILGELFRRLSGWADANPPTTVHLAPLDVRFAADRILQPDLFLVLDGLPRDVASPITRIPELVVEVLGGRNRSYDRIAKRAIYAEAGVAEYWVVDLQQTRVEVFHGSETAEIVTETLTSARLPGFALDVPQLLRRS